MSGYPHGGMGPPPPIPPRPGAYRQGTQQPYHTQETTESPAWRVPYQETEVLISTVDSSATTSPAGYSETNLSRSSSRRTYQETYAKQVPETYAMQNSRFKNTSETTESDARHPSHNMAVEGRGHTETEWSRSQSGRVEKAEQDWSRSQSGRVEKAEQDWPRSQTSRVEQSEQDPVVSDGMQEGLSQLGWGGIAFYDTSRPSNWAPAPPQPENIHQDRDNTGLRTMKKEIEPEYEKISMDYYDHFTPSFTPASAPPQLPPSLPEVVQPPVSSYSAHNSPGTTRPQVPHLSVSDPYPISVEHERYASSLSDLRESQFPEPVNLAGSDPFWQPPSRSYTSYRRTPRRPNEAQDYVAPKLDSNGLPSLTGLLGPSTNQQEQSGRNSFHFEDEKRFYTSNFNQSAVSINSTHSENIPPSSRYGNNINRTPSYASLRPDNDTRPQDTKYNYNSPGEEENKSGIPPPPTRYFSQRQGNNKLGQIMQEKKMEYVVAEINRKDDLHRRIQEESRRWGY